ncbi:MAG: MFS transporter [Bacteroidales bacterium]|jgi:fucose permease|nr:MFS transporter [Bacteroidales bacterium]
MSESKISLKFVTPVLMSFFVMSFCDIVGIGVDRIKIDFSLSNTLAQLIPSAVFLWFFVLSVPVGILQDRIGKRTVLNIGMTITAIGLFFPFFFYSFGTVLFGFAMLGIGNTIVQVSANPLLVDVVPSARRSSLLSFSQFVKSIGSMIAAPFAGWLALQFGDWKLLLPVFGIVSVLSVIWLYFTDIRETKNTEKRATFASSFKLLGTGYIAMMVLGIFLVVGIDVGINAFSGQFLLAKFNSPQTFAESGRSVYFFGKMLGTFGGAIMLVKLSTRKFFIWSAILGLISILSFIFAPSGSIAMALIFVIGLGVANIFPVIYSLTVGKYPLRSNEISGLMIMAVSGGAVIPLVMGWISDISGNVTIAMMVLVVSITYLLLVSLFQTKSQS